MTYVVYTITNQNNGHVFVGTCHKSKTVQNLQLLSHLIEARNYRPHFAYSLHNAIRVHGPKPFTFDTVTEYTCRETALQQANILATDIDAVYNKPPVGKKTRDRNTVTYRIMQSQYRRHKDKLIRAKRRASIRDQVIAKIANYG